MNAFYDDFYVRAKKNYAHRELDCRFLSVTNKN
jgi:hypothetical protein